MTVAVQMAEIAEALTDLAIPVLLTEESGPYQPGVNLWRMTRSDLPSRTYPYWGIAVAVMYEPRGEPEAQHRERVAQVRAVLLATYPDRYRPLPWAGSSQMLIEDAGTAYARWRASENAKRARLDFKPLHEIGQ